MSILRATQRLPRQTVYAAVTDPNAALAATAQAADSGEYDAASLIHPLNPQAGNHPVGLAILLTTLAAAGDPRMTEVAGDLLEAGAAPGVLAALPQIAPLLKSEPMQRAVQAVTTTLSDRS